MSKANVKAREARAGRSQKLPTEECGIKVTRNPAEMGKLLKSVLK